MKVLRPKIELLWLSTVDQGKQLELNSSFDGLSHSLATIVADHSDESLWFELYVNDTVVQIPLATLQEAIDAAPGNVHSEAWYEQNQTGYNEPGLTHAARAFLKRGSGNGT